MKSILSYEFATIPGGCFPMRGYRRADEKMDTNSMKKIGETGWLQTIQNEMLSPLEKNNRICPERVCAKIIAIFSTEINIPLRGE
jgi:hypothetical protein